MKKVQYNEKLANTLGLSFFTQGIDQYTAKNIAYDVAWCLYFGGRDKNHGPEKLDLYRVRIAFVEQVMKQYQWLMDAPEKQCLVQVAKCFVCLRGIRT